mgnify:CR=1 FL=1
MRDEKATEVGYKAEACTKETVKKTNFIQINGTDIIPVSICAYPPYWFNGPNIKELAPPGNIVISIKNNQIDENEYIKIYTNHIYDLINSNKDFIPNIINRYSYQQDIALCCFETPDKFCHRHLLADILNKEYGYDIKEFGKETSNKLF